MRDFQGTFDAVEDAALSTEDRILVGDDFSI